MGVTLWPEAMGVYGIFRENSDEGFVGFSRNLKSTGKRLRFELKLNACSYKSLQSFYNECNGGVCFVMLEEYMPPSGYSEEEVESHLQALMMKYKAKFGARIIQRMAGYQD